MTRTVAAVYEVSEFEIEARSGSGAGLPDVKCWDVPCTMSNVLVQRPEDQMTKYASWSVGRLTDTFDIVHGTSQHLTSGRFLRCHEPRFRFIHTFLGAKPL